MIIGVAMKIAKSKTVRRLAKTAARQAAKQVKVTRKGNDIELAIGGSYKVTASEIKDMVRSRNNGDLVEIPSSGFGDKDWMN